MFSIIQFPWRLYSVATLCIIFVTCYFFKEKKENKLKKVTIIYVSVLFLINCLFTLLFPTITNKLSEDSIMFGEYLPIEMKDNYLTIINNYKNKNIKYEYKDDKLIVEINKNTENIELPLIYYKGYEAISNGTHLEVNKSNKGLVNVIISNGIRNFTVCYKGTKIRSIGIILTSSSTIVYLIFMIIKKENN